MCMPPPSTQVQVCMPPLPPLRGQISCDVQPAVLAAAPSMDELDKYAHKQWEVRQEGGQEGGLGSDPRPLTHTHTLLHQLYLLPAPPPLADPPALPAPLPPLTDPPAVPDPPPLTPLADPPAVLAPPTHTQTLQLYLPPPHSTPSQTLQLYLLSSSSEPPLMPSFVSVQPLNIHRLLQAAKLLVGDKCVYRVGWGGGVSAMRGRGSVCVGGGQVRVPWGGVGACECHEGDGQCVWVGGQVRVPCVGGHVSAMVVGSGGSAVVGRFVVWGGGGGELCGGQSRIGGGTD